MKHTMSMYPTKDAMIEQNKLEQARKIAIDAGVWTGVPLFVLYHFPDAENMVTHH